MTQNIDRLRTRRTEILDQLDRVNEDLGTELDRDPEEQAIEVQNEQVAVTMEANLRKELAAIEEQLIDADNK